MTFHSRLKIRFVLMLSLLLFLGIAGFSGLSLRAEGKPAPSLWTMRCDPLRKDGTKFCEVFQRLSEKKTGERVFEFALSYPNDGDHNRLHGVMILPLGILVNSDVLIAADGQVIGKTRPTYCLAAGCVAVADFDKTGVTRLTSAHKLAVSVHSATGAPVTITLQLDGLDAALKRL